MLLPGFDAVPPAFHPPGKAVHVVKLTSGRRFGLFGTVLGNDGVGVLLALDLCVVVVVVALGVVLHPASRSPATQTTMAPGALKAIKLILRAPLTDLPGFPLSVLERASGQEVRRRRISMRTSPVPVRMSTIAPSISRASGAPVNGSVVTGVEDGEVGVCATAAVTTLVAFTDAVDGVEVTLVDFVGLTGVGAEPEAVAELLTTPLARSPVVTM